MDKLDKEVQLNNFIRIYDNILPENVLKNFLIHFQEEYYHKNI